MYCKHVQSFNNSCHPHSRLEPSRDDFLSHNSFKDTKCNMCRVIIGALTMTNPHLIILTPVNKVN